MLIFIVIICSQLSNFLEENASKGLHRKITWTDAVGAGKHEQKRSVPDIFI